MPDPNIAYLVLLFGMWASVTGAYIPGTGVIEVVGLGTLGLGVYLLLSLPTNWLGVLILAAGVACFMVAPFFSRIARYAEGGLVLQSVGALLMFSGMLVNPLLIAGTVALSLVYHRIVLKPILTDQISRKQHIEESIIGAYGRVISPVDPERRTQPSGTVQVRGELWTARSEHTLSEGDEIVVVDQDGLQLFVEPGRKRKRLTSHEIGEGML